jgi:hypothetical protein
MKIKNKIKKFFSEELNKGNEAKKSFTVEEAQEIGEQLGVKFDKFDVEEFRKGLDIELEHGTRSPETNITDDDPIETAKITLAHLNEIPDYNTRLLNMEKEAKGNKK